MTSNDLRQKYLDFYRARGHQVIPAVPLVPENDPTTLLVNSGMQPLLPYFLGEPHPLGNRVVDSQLVIRANGFNDDTEEVGDNRHTTCFEMLGNWSFGEYFKKEQLPWVFEFLTDVAGLDPNRIFVSIFSGDPTNNIPLDSESIEIWKQLFQHKGIEAKEVILDTEENGAKLGMQGGRIFGYGVKKNWWSRVGIPSNMPAGEPGGPDSELFYEFPDVEHNSKYGENCHPNCDCGRYLEIGNSVFMQYQKQDDGSFKELPKKNVDFGGGLERILASTNDKSDVFDSDLFSPIIHHIEEITGKNYQADYQSSIRIIADHVKATTFLIVQGVEPSNKQQGYILRRFIRRTAVKLYKLSGKIITTEEFIKLTEKVIEIYSNIDPTLGFALNPEKNLPVLKRVLTQELEKFSKSLEKGLKEINKKDSLNGTDAFDLYQTYGFPLELTLELATEKGHQVDKSEFHQQFEKHKELSRTASAGMFKGGLAEHSDETTKLHTATHLLHQALRQVLGDHVQQKGSNITVERLRFDFSHPTKMTDDQIQQVEQSINQIIAQSLPVNKVILDREEAEQSGALHFFGDKYGDKVSIYYIGNSLENAFSKEFCGGPHVSNTSKIGKIKITKEESAGSGIRRIYASLT